MAPFSLELTAWGLRRRPENQVDRWDGTAYQRVIGIHGRPGEVSVSERGSREAPRLEVNVIGARVHWETKAEVRTLLTHMLGLQVDLKPFYRMASREPKLRELAERYRGLKPSRFPTVFEALANAFACQQFTIAVAHTVTFLTAGQIRPPFSVGCPGFSGASARRAPGAAWLFELISLRL